MSHDDTDIDDFGAEGAHEAPPADYDVSVISVDGKDYAVNVLWNTIENRSKASDEAREMAARPSINADLFCLRQSGTQYGLGRKDDGHTVKMVSLAGALADKRGGSWAGVYYLPNVGYYMIAVRDGDILSQTDKVYLDEMDAKMRLQELIEMAEFEEIFAPDNFGFPEAKPVDLAAQLGKVKGPRFQTTDKVSSLLKIIVGGGALILLIGGGLFWMDYQSKMEWERLQQQLAAPDPVLGPQQPEIVIPPMPWEGRAVGVSWLEACEKAMNRAVMFIPGWSVSGLACDYETGVRMSVDRDGNLGEGGGPINWVRWALDEGGLNNASANMLNNNENRVEVVWPIDGAETHEVDIDTPTLAESRRYLQSWFEEYFTPISFPETQTTDFVATLRFSFETDFQPTVFKSILEKIPGLTIESVILDLVDYKYIVQGSVYEQLPLPEIPNAPAS